jgi:hypothetical protein
VPRGSVSRPGPGGNTTIIVNRGYYGGFYPWGYAGLGFGGYYGGFYDPWWDPYYYGGGGGWGGGGGGGGNFDYGYVYPGRLRLKVKPRAAEVYVDGYFAGTVDDFDGVLQRLTLESGPHRIEVRHDDYETLTFDVRITPDQTTTYSGAMKRLP